MKTIRTIKGIDDATWARFKNYAAQSKVTMGELFKIMIEEQKRHSDDFWNKIFAGKKILNDEEARELGNVLRKIRKEQGFRK